MTLGVVDLSYLTDEEREKILQVIRRDDQLRDSEQSRIRSLKDEVKTLRLKGTIREGRNATRTCARCRESFGLIFNTGSVCPKCQHCVCKKCQQSVAPGKWICLFCFRQMEYEAKSGNWFYSKFPRKMRDKATNEIVFGGSIVRDAISSSDGNDDLDYVCDAAETSRADLALPLPSSPHSSGKNRSTIPPTDVIPDTYHDSYSSHISPNLRLTPPDSGGKTVWMTGREDFEDETETHGRSVNEILAVRLTKTSDVHELQIESERSYDGTEMQENPELLQKCDTEAFKISNCINSRRSTHLNEEHPDDVFIFSIAGDFQKTSSEAESQNLDFNFSGSPRIVDADVAPSGVEFSDGRGDDNRKPCGVCDSNDSAFEDDVDCQVHLGSNFSDVSEGSCEGVRVSFSPDIRDSPVKFPNAAMTTEVTLTDSCNKTIHCDADHLDQDPASTANPRVSTPVSDSNSDDTLDMTERCGSSCTDSKEVSTSRDASVFKFTSSCEDDFNHANEPVTMSIVTGSDSFLSSESPSVDQEWKILNPVGNCQDCVSKVYQIDKDRLVRCLNGCENNFDKKNEDVSFHHNNDSGVEMAEFETVIGSDNIITEPEVSSTTFQDFGLPQVLECENGNLEFARGKEVCVPNTLHFPVQHDLVPDNELHVTPQVTCSSSSTNFTSILDGGPLEKTGICGNGSTYNCNNEVKNEDSVRSKVGALLAKYSHRLDSEQRSEDLGTKISCSSHDRSPEDLNNIISGQDFVFSPEIESKVGFHERAASSRDLSDELDMSDFNNCSENLLRSERSLSPRNLSKHSNDSSENICQAKTTEVQPADGITSLAICDLSDEECGSDGTWDCDTADGFNRGLAEDDFYGDMEWDGIELVRAIEGNIHSGKNLEISGEFNSQTSELSALRDMLSSCLTNSSFLETDASPPRSLSPTEGEETIFGSACDTDHRVRPKRRFLSAFSTGLDRGRDAFVKDDDVLSVISEHSEPDSDGADS